MFSKSNLWKQIKYSLPLEYITYAKFISGLDFEKWEGSNQNHIVVFTNNNGTHTADTPTDTLLRDNATAATTTTTTTN